MSWREEKKIEIRQRLFEISLDLFREQGYAATTVHQITERARVGKGTFFNYFPSKEQVLTQWYRGLHEEAIAACKNRDFASARDAIFSFLIPEARKAMQEKHLVVAKNQLSQQQSPIGGIEQSQDEETYDYCVQYLRQDKQAGRINSALDIGHFANLILTVMTGNARRWVYQHGDYDLAESIEKDLDYLFDGIELEQ